MAEKKNTRSAAFPSEFMTFLSSTGGHSLIIRGMAGTGKTTLALQLIEELAAVQQSYYMSTRVSDQSLFNQIPWLLEKVREGENLKARKKMKKKTDSEQQVEKILVGLAAIKGEMKSEKIKAPGVCEYADTCGGSRARAFAAFGDALGEDPACGYQPAAFATAT